MLRIMALVALTLMPLCGAADDASFTFVQLCDPQLGAGGLAHDVETLRKAVTHINRLKPAFVVVCGDFTNDARDKSAVQTFKEIIADFDMPCHLVPGNHDLGPGSGRTAIGRYKRSYGLDHYFFDHGAYRFIVVNTELWVHEVPLATMRHDNWFEATLAEGEATGKQLVVAGHVPPYVFTADEVSAYANLPLEKRGWLLDRFAQYNVRLMLAGHLHANLLRKHGETLIAVSATTSINRDNQAMGFRLWTAHPDGTLDESYIAVEGAEAPPEQEALARETLATILKQIKR